MSDGTLRYLGLAGALLAYRLPAFIALNEPEASLHPDLLEPLARLIVRASERTQIWLAPIPNVWPMPLRATARSSRSLL